MSPGVYHRSWSEVIEMDEVLLLLQVIQWERSQKKKKKRERKKPRMITIEGDGYEKMEEGQPPALRVGMES